MKSNPTSDSNHIIIKTTERGDAKYAEFPQEAMSLPTLKGREFTVSGLYLRVHISVVGWMPIINRPRYFSVLEVELIPNLLSHDYQSLISTLQVSK